MNVTPENIEHVLNENDVCGEPDLLSLQVDGMDFRVWKALSAFRPRVVIARTCRPFGVPMHPSAYRIVPISRRSLSTDLGSIAGPPLPAMVKLARSKDYRLVGAQRYGFNAVFVRNDVGVGVLPEVQPEDCFHHPFVAWTRETFLSSVADREWVQV